MMMALHLQSSEDEEDASPDTDMKDVEAEESSDEEETVRT